VNWSKKHIILYGSLLVSSVCYVLIAFFTERTQYEQLFSLVALLFGCYWVIYKFAAQNTSLRFWFQTAIIFRCIFLFSTPALSDDYHRFVWDGNVLTNGYNPFQFKPIDAPEDLTIGQYQFDLLQNMNSIEYYSIYPPILQTIFATTTFLSGDNILVNVMLLKLLILIFEGLTLFLLYRLLTYLKQPPERWLLYAFNPLIIIELVGNLHFEGIMITGLLGTVYLLTQEKYKWATIPFIIGVGIKLLPLILLPLIWVKLGWKKGFVFAALVGLGMIAMFAPFINEELISNFSNSLNLYFQTFEFNASIYYVFRWIGFQWSGYNMIDTIGIINGLLTLALILFISFRKQNNWEKTLLNMLLIFGVYLSFASIVHPWYISTLILFGVFTQYRFMIVWSALIILSYYTYKDDTYTESMWLVMIEYGIVFSYFIYEIYRQKSNKSTAAMTEN
jgi:hypothetical protein